jgi:hypothetical protein
LLFWNVVVVNVFLCNVASKAKALFDGLFASLNKTSHPIPHFFDAKVVDVIKIEVTL